jgi:DNA-binding transcriptional LysR family regulator
LASIGESPRIAVEVASREAIVPLVLHNAGAALLPRPIADDAARRGAIVIPTDPPITRRIGIAHRAAPLSPAAKSFLEIAGVAAPATTRQ